ncbi:MAG: sugar phosphorylase [Ruminiclostridium sp.]|nr:sugar phosphorylase [Ruminiclostridium sp.]
MHKICYKNTLSRWDEALPLGNGHFGAMVYNNQEGLVYAVNHYDVYYRRLYLYCDWFKDEKKEKPTDTSQYEIIQERALKAHGDPADPAHYNYNFVFFPEMKESYGVERSGSTQPFTGELHILLDESVKGADEYESCLEIENATHKYTAKIIKGDITISTIISQDSDILLSRVKQTGENKIRAIEITVPERRYLEIKSEYKVYNGNTVYFINSFYPDKAEKEADTPFRYIFMLRFTGAKSSGITVQKGKLKVDIARAEGDFDLMTCVVTEEETGDLLETAVKRLDEAEKDVGGIVENHREYWDKFWSKSSIGISDSMLEKLWYMNLYSLECCSGRGARLYEQACGLNGLWDIKQPSQWGSMWYWDVNIQQSFWPVYTSNHLELGEVFCNGLLSYANIARNRAKELYGMRGIASDYPHAFYNSMWLWSAQYLWWYYQYSGDVVFLKEKAYPLFKDLLLFFEDFLKYDEAKGQYYIFPDVSPEQGPMTRNSTITLACLKFMIKASITANTLLKESEEDRLKWENIYNLLPFYSLGESLEFGKALKDSEWADPTQYLAHSSVLMPIYPVSEISKRSNAGLAEIGKNTLRYAETLQNLGTHSFGWVACSAARLGLGDETYKILYEKGIAFLMRTNGLFSEETGRWIQNCLTACLPVYNPPLIESGSATVAAINEMLLQSFNGVIEVFPALPRGENRDDAINGIFDNVLADSSSNPEAWKDCHFENLLAEGAFEVSAYQEGTVTSLIKIRSIAGNIVKLINPFIPKVFSVKCAGKDVNYELSGNIISFETLKNAAYEIKPLEGDAGCSCRSKIACNRIEYNQNSDRPEIDDRPQIYVAPTKRRVFLGKNEDVDFLSKLDNITFDYYQGDLKTSRVAVYRFDFSLPAAEMEKDYGSILPRQYHGCGKQGMNFIRVTGDMDFTPFRGYGWDDVTSLRYLDRGAPDPFRRDFVCGCEERTFKIELPEGQYQIFIVTGDSCDKTYTAIDINGQQKWKPKTVIKPGRFEAVVLPVVQYEDGVMDIAVSTLKGYEWKINMIVVNRLL